MAHVQPFRATLFDPAAAGKLGEVLCPPYDVISQQEQYRLYLRSHSNVVRLELGQDLADDSQQVNRYTRARDQLDAWLRDGVLREDEWPAFYLYDQAWAGGRRRSFFGAVRLAAWDERAILPHEQTLSGPKADRLLLMRHTAANLSPVFGLYDDPSGAAAGILTEVAAREPDLVADQGGGEVHELWRIIDPDAIATIQEALSARPIYIADGHHRYETALTYRDERRDAQEVYSGDEPWNQVLMCLSDLGDPGLVVLPTHRLVKADGSAPAEILSRLGDRFDIEELPASAGGSRFGEVSGALDMLAARAAQGRPCFGLVLRGDPAVRLLALRADPVGALAHLGRSEAWRRLDVAVLHFLVIADILGVPESDWKGGRKLVYTRDFREVLIGMESGEFQAGFFLNPTPVAQIRAVADAGDVMPQKSTFFDPKVPTGLVIHRLGEVPQPLSRVEG